jgi:hypothetical protein
VLIPCIRHARLGDEPGAMLCAKTRSFSARFGEKLVDPGGFAPAGDDHDIERRKRNLSLTRSVMS